MAITNTAANTALRYMDINKGQAASSMGKLSSGTRIVKASDDAAGLAVGTKLKADVTALKQAKNNASHATSLLQVADGGLSQTSDILMRMKALSVQAQSGSVTNTERGYMDKEFEALGKQIDAIAAETKFSGKALLNGTVGNEVKSTGPDVNGKTLKVTDLATAGLTTDDLNVDNAAAGAYELSYTKGTDGTSADQFSLTFTDASGSSQTATVNVGDQNATAYDGTIDFGSLGVQLKLDNFDLSDTGANVTAANATFAVDASNALDFQVGVSASEKIAVSLSDVRTTALGNTATGTLGDVDGTASAATLRADITTGANAVKAGNIIDKAIEQINESRASVGAQISRFEFAGANLATSIENLDAARSSIMDVDMASEMTAFSAKNVQVQASVAMLAQANQQPQQMLRLLN